LGINGHGKEGDGDQECKSLFHSLIFRLMNWFPEQSKAFSGWFFLDVLLKRGLDGIGFCLTFAALNT
jgi:hypothetical protein